eukprot:224344-Chlamydomonas_euryale.AAC.1
MLYRDGCLKRLCTGRISSVAEGGRVEQVKIRKGHRNIESGFRELYSSVIWVAMGKAPVVALLWGPSQTDSPHYIHPLVRDSSEGMRRGACKGVPGACKG